MPCVLSPAVRSVVSIIIFESNFDISIISVKEGDRTSPGRSAIVSKTFHKKFFSFQCNVTKYEFSWRILYQYEHSYVWLWVRGKKRKNLLLKEFFTALEKSLNFSCPINGFIFVLLPRSVCYQHSIWANDTLPTKSTVYGAGERVEWATHVHSSGNGRGQCNSLRNFFRHNSAFSAIILPFSLARTIPFSSLSMRWMKKPFRRSFTVSWTDRLCCGRLKLECGQLFFFFFFFFLFFFFSSFFSNLIFIAVSKWYRILYGSEIGQWRFFFWSFFLQRKIYFLLTSQIGDRVRFVSSSLPISE